MHQQDFHANHLGTIHASAQYALAEATSGEFLLSNRGNMTKLGGVVRKSNCKYSAPATGSIYSRVKTDVEAVEEAKGKVLSKGRALLSLEVELLDIKEKVLSSYEFVWMIALDDTN